MRALDLKSSNQMVLGNMKPLTRGSPTCSFSIATPVHMNKIRMHLTAPRRAVNGGTGIPLLINKFIGSNQESGSYALMNGTNCICTSGTIGGCQWPTDSTNMCSTTVVETHFNKFSVQRGAPQKIIRNSLIRVLAAQIQRLRGVPTILYECVAPASLKPVHLQN